MTRTTYTVEELFEDIPGDTENVMLKIPEDICEAQGWKPGDTVSVTVEEGKLFIAKV